MDTRDVVSARRFKEFDESQKEELYETLLQFSNTIEEIPKKSLRKILEVSLAVLQYKGQQVNELKSKSKSKKTPLQESSSSEESFRSSRLSDENDRLKTLLQNLEDEKRNFESKIKELSNEVILLQKRLQEALTAADLSDKDSSDPLSELDRQEDLLRNINRKNKHIKRLLKEIEILQKQNIEQSKILIGTEQELNETTSKLKQLTNDYNSTDMERKNLKDKVNELNIQVTRLEANMNYMEEERLTSERDLKNFIDKLEIKAQSWKQMLEGKEQEINELNNELKRVKQTSPPGMSFEIPQDDEMKRLKNALTSRDKFIESLEEKIKTMAEEMLTQTNLMNQISAGKLDQRNPNKPRACCKTIEESLNAANERCKELSEMIDKIEEDNLMKSKEAAIAIAQLDSYQKGEDGLVSALNRCINLEHKLRAREKHIKNLVMELNSMNEIAQENKILRKRLNIGEDVVIVTRSVTAKERNKDKVIERLNLKLRASEEGRLQLKLDKCELKRELLKLQHLHSPTKPNKVNYLEDLRSIQIPSEFGEVEDSIHSSLSLGEKPLINPSNRTFSIDYGAKYQELIEENETLRLGMLEILDNLRDYNANSEHITINTEILNNLLQTLQKNTHITIENRLQKELEDLKQREEALRELLNQDPFKDELEDGEANSDRGDHQTGAKYIEPIEGARNIGEAFEQENISIDLPEILDTSTRPTTPNKDLKQSQIPIISGEVINTKLSIKERNLILQVEELQIYKNHYEDLSEHLNYPEDDIKASYTLLDAKILQLELDLKRKTSANEYIQEDYDRSLTLAKQTQVNFVQQIADLNFELCEEKLKIERLELEIKNLRSSSTYTDDEFRNLMKINSELKAQLANHLEGALSERLLPDVCADYGIIRDNLQLDFISIEEYEEQKKYLQIANEKQTEMSQKAHQLESLLEIAQNQIQSQQKLLNELTDNHINLRHLVADLQSSTEEKFLLAKTQRDLDCAKTEISNLKFAHEQLSQQHDLLKCQLTKEQKNTAEIKNSFQSECNNRDIKIRFLQKSLFILKQKYAKFTPLIFLTNFLYAYKNFLKKCAQTEKAAIPEHILQNIDEFIKVKLPITNEQTDEKAINLIKLIKAETQCKLLEESYQSLEIKCDKLQEELNEMRIRFASEKEHWQTIEVLFGSEDKVSEEKPSTNFENENPQENIVQIGEVCVKDVATNTDIPIPAERRALRKQSSGTSEENNNSPSESPKKLRRLKDSTQRRCSRDSINSTNGTDYSKKSPKNSPKTQQHKQFNDFGVQVSLSQSKDVSNEENSFKSKSRKNIPIQKHIQVQTIPANISSKDVQTEEIEYVELVDELRDQLKSSQQKLVENDQLLYETKNDLKASKRLVEDLQEKLSLAERRSTTKSEYDGQAQINQAGIIEKTIFSFHTLLSEKDKSINKYQDLLQSERNQNDAMMKQLHTDNDSLKSTINELNFSIKAKNMEIMDLKTQLETLTVRRNSLEKLQLATRENGELDESGDNSLNELTDEKLEEMFQQESPDVPAITIMEEIDEENHEHDHNPSQQNEETIEKHDREKSKEVPNMQKQIKELRDKITFLDKTIKTKEDELQLTKEKLNLQEEREKSVESSTNPEIENLRMLLDEKDKHINDLMETLNNFHDDQQRYIADSSTYSADQISKLAADLTRTEATNKIYQTQVEALRRQLSTLSQREKQARELNQSLRNQLIKRPVVSIKTELNARAKNENLQKRVSQLEQELDDARNQIQRQQIMIDTKRARNASEIGLWEKQKRWQQSAEKYKAKLEETECILEKNRTLLQSARNTIARLEKDKQTLENKLSKINHQHNHSQPVHGMKCCRTPSCPNLQPAPCQNPNSISKYTPSESPETFTGPSSECSSPSRGGLNPTQSNQATLNFFADNQSELIEALKARIEIQQRKIIAMELEGKGSNALTTELEKLQERCSGIEAQNIRLEAKNLQIQLENDMLRQGDTSERLTKRVKHLEDYIIALKEEMAHLEVKHDICKCSTVKPSSSHHQQSADQTILSLRRIVEKLKAENKFLKDGRRSCESRSSTETPTNDVNKLQKMYAESLDKITALQIELNIKSKCPHCGNRARGETQQSEEIRYIKEQLIRKTQLLQKAKVLLTRAAAKEKVLKDQIAVWKRKCSELQNVPVIDEISE